MNLESIRVELLQMPHVVETMQWGDSLVFWVGDKAIGGRMFALVHLDGLDGKSNAAKAGAAMMFAAGPERFSELLENEGVIPAPYMARIYWVALEHFDVFRSAELVELLAQAHAMTYAKLPKKTRDLLALPRRELGTLVAAHRKRLATAAKKQAEARERAKARAAIAGAMKKAAKAKSKLV